MVDDPSAYVDVLKAAGCAAEGALKARLGFGRRRALAKEGSTRRSQNQARHRRSSTYWLIRNASGSSASSKTSCCGRATNDTVLRQRVTRSGRVGDGRAPRMPTMLRRGNHSTGRNTGARPVRRQSAALEAQRLGLASYASDLNPVAVLINKAMIEIPPRFAGKPPVSSKARGEIARSGAWHGKGVSGF